MALQGSLGHSLRVVSANVDGLGNSYGPLRPPDRMKANLKALLAQRPTVILLQEVIDSMYRVLLDVLDPLGWVVKKRRCTSEAYFVVSAASVLAPESLVWKSSSFPTSQNGRHYLTLRGGPWAIVNVHLESGSVAVLRDERNTQIQHLSRKHELSHAEAYVIVGDWNMREGEEHCMQTEGWRDAWLDAPTHCAVPQEEWWTWAGYGCRARYDRVFVHDSDDTRVRCASVEILREAVAGLTDHAALCADLEIAHRPALEPAVAANISQCGAAPGIHSRGAQKRGSPAPESVAAEGEESSARACAPGASRALEGSPHRAKPGLPVLDTAGALRTGVLAFRHVAAI